MCESQPHLRPPARGNAIQQALDQFGDDAKLRKKATSWYRHSDEVISVTNLQKSRGAPRYYINQAFYLRQLGDERYPKEWGCHVRWRLEQLCPDVMDKLKLLLDLGAEIPDAERFSELLALLLHRIPPIIERGNSIAGLRTMLQDEWPGFTIVAPIARPVLYVESEGPRSG